jgi:hypothetical protein
VKALRLWALACAAAGMALLSSCRYEGDQDLKVSIDRVLPEGTQALDLSSAVRNQVLLQIRVHMRAEITKVEASDGDGVLVSFADCPPPPPDVALNITHVVYPGPLEATAHVPGRPGQRVQLQGLELVPDGTGWTCDGAPFEFRYMLRVTDPALLPSQPTGEFELTMQPEYCEYYTAFSGRFVGVPETGSAACGRYPAKLRVRITAVPAATPGTMLQVRVQGPGRVLSTPSGIECGADCAQDFPPGTEVTLSALPDNFGRFVGFSGDTGCTTGRFILGTTALTCIAEFAEAGAAPVWQAVGGALNVDPVPSQATGPAVVLAAGNMPWVAWGENGLLQVKRWDGNDWQLMGELSVLQSVVDAPVMALDADGQPWVAWQEDAAGSGQVEVYVKRWDGANWQVAVLPATNSFSRSMPHLALHQGRMLLAWVDRSPFGQNVRLYGWDGSAWQHVAGSALGDEELMVPRIASDGSELKVAYVAGNARVQLARLLTALQFLQVEASFDEFVSSVPALALLHSPRDGWLLALQPTGAQGRNFQVRRWAGVAWDTLGGVHGRSEPGGLVTGLAMVNTSADQPLLAWAERYGGVHRLLVQRWENGAWVDQGSAVGLVGRFGPGIEGPVALADGLRPTLAYGVRSAGTVGGQFATDDAIRAVELR